MNLHTYVMLVFLILSFVVPPAEAVIVSSVNTYMDYKNLLPIYALEELDKVYERVLIEKVFGRRVKLSVELIDHREYILDNGFRVISDKHGCFTITGSKEYDKYGNVTNDLVHRIISRINKTLVEVSNKSIVIGDYVVNKYGVYWPEGSIIRRLDNSTLVSTPIRENTIIVFELI